MRLEAPTKITIEIPDAMRESLLQELGEDVPQAVKEALAVALYQADKFSTGRVAELLETSIDGADGVLKRWRVDAHYSYEDFERDSVALRSLLPSPDEPSGAP